MNSPEVTSQLVVSTSPHIKAEDSISSIMRTVALALLPAMAFALYRFGYWAGVVIVLAVVASLLTEVACQRLRCQPLAINDWSAVVTGLLLAAVLPANVSWFIPIIGGVVAIGIAKHCFGGLGANIWNPALIGRAFLQAAYPTQINSGSWAAVKNDTIGGALATNIMGSFASLVERAKTAADIISSATPLEQLSKLAETTQTATLSVQNGTIQVSSSLIKNAFLGQTVGCLGEVSALALLLGGIYMLIKKVITWEIPVTFLLTLSVCAWILPAPYQTGSSQAYTEWFSGPWQLHLFTGGVFIGAFFMATDMVTSPITKSGRFIFALGCGMLTILIRLYAGYPEGVCYAILLMNTLVPIIDIYTKPKIFGKRPEERN